MRSALALKGHNKYIANEKGLNGGSKKAES